MIDYNLSRDIANIREALETLNKNGVSDVSEDTMKEVVAQLKGINQYLAVICDKLAAIGGGK